MTVGRSVTTTYRYKPPPQKRQALATAGPAVVRKAKPGNDTRPEAEHLPTAGKRPTIVATRRRGKRKCRRARHDAGGAPAARRCGRRTVPRTGAPCDRIGIDVYKRSGGNQC
jgi:hypothetical protein